MASDMEISYHLTRLFTMDDGFKLAWAHTYKTGFNVLEKSKLKSCGYILVASAHL
jgi:hypothetical protein